MKTPSRDTGRLRMVAGSTAASLTLMVALVAVGSSPSAAQVPTMSASPTSGPVGTVVTLRGNAGPGCNASSFPTLVFEHGATGPVEFIVLPVASDGSWSAKFVIPPFVGYEATRGYPGSNATPGTWEFQGAVCTGQVGATTTVPFQVTGTFAAQPPSRFVGIASSPDGKGYWLAQSDGGVFGYGDAGFKGALPTGPGGLGIIPAAPISGIAATTDGRGYWLVGQDGGVYAFGDAVFYGSLPSSRVTPFGVIVGITPTPDGKGYWLLGADGGVFTFGDAGFYGAQVTGSSVTALAATPDGKGYLVMSAFGDAPVVEGDARLPSDREPGPMTLDALASGAAITPDGNGFWEIGTDGGIFTFGDAGFYGSLPGIGVAPAAPIIGIARTPDGSGYWLVGADGGVFTFGDARFYGCAA